MSPQNLSRRAQACIAAELRPGETLHWCGNRGRLPRGAVSMLLIFNLIACVLCAVAAAVVWQKTQSVTGCVLLLLPVCVAAWLSHRKVRAYGKSIYMLTNHRVAWLTVGIDDSVSLPLTQNMVRRVVMKPAGFGDIVFSTAADDESAVFCNVPNVRAVVQLINDLSAGR